MVPVMAFSVLFNLPKFFEVTFTTFVRQIEVFDNEGNVIDVVRMGVFTFSTFIA